MPKNKGLGRGLDALLGDFEAAPPEGVSEVDVHLIDNNPGQPRKTFDEGKLNDLAASIKRQGIIQPILLRRNGERFTIVAGERRYRAARIAGLSTVPAIVKDYDDAQIMEVALIENLQRENLNPIEEAAAIRFLMKEHDLTQEEVAEHLSRSRPSITNTLRLLNLPDDIQTVIASGTLSAAHGRAIAGLKDREQQHKLADEIVAKGLSVHAAEKRVSDINKPRPQSQSRPQSQKQTQPQPKYQIPIDDEHAPYFVPGAPGQVQKPKDADSYIDKTAPYNVHPDREINEAITNLRNYLCTRVVFKGSRSRGQIIIDYYSYDALSWYYDILMKDSELYKYGSAEYYKNHPELTPNNNDPKKK